MCRRLGQLNFYFYLLNLHCITSVKQPVLGLLEVLFFEFGRCVKEIKRRYPIENFVVNY